MARFIVHQSGIESLFIILTRLFLRFNSVKLMDTILKRKQRHRLFVESIRGVKDFLESNCQANTSINRLRKASIQQWSLLCEMEAPIGDFEVIVHQELHQRS